MLSTTPRLMTEPARAQALILWFDEVSLNDLSLVGGNGLEVYMMCEVPSNVILAAEFCQIFDGFSIGSNDLTQLTLGLVG
jgi:phosphoenolpyruvate synthase/pyruvate phosphate dikinase